MKARFGDVEFDVETERDIEMLLDVVGKEEPYLETDEFRMVKKQTAKEYAKAKGEAQDAYMGKAKPKGRRKGHKLEYWEKFEDSIIKQNTPREAFRLLAGKRSKNAIYMRRKHLNVTVERKHR
jgi:hypothetical protein